MENSRGMGKGSLIYGDEAEKTEGGCLTKSSYPNCAEKLVLSQEREGPKNTYLTMEFIDKPGSGLS